GVRGDDGVHPARPSALYTHADGSIGSVRGLRRPQTTIDASSVFGLSAPMCSRPSHEQFFMSHMSLLQAADVAGNRLSQNRAQTPPRERDRLGGVSARFAIMSSDETAATGFGAFLFLSGRLALSSYHTNNTRLAEAPFAPFGDDNGPGSEPPPRNRIGIAMALMPSRRRSPAARGKQSFPYFKADYLPRRREQF
ncbi:hypothetical protein THAOC_00595, partial [Thalassiosira oceanica]